MFVVALILYLVTGRNVHNIFSIPTAFYYLLKCRTPGQYCIKFALSHLDFLFENKILERTVCYILFKLSGHFGQVMCPRGYCRYLLYPPSYTCYSYILNKCFQVENSLQIACTEMLKMSVLQVALVLRVEHHRRLHAVVKICYIFRGILVAHYRNIFNVQSIMLRILEIPFCE